MFVYFNKNPKFTAVHAIHNPPQYPSSHRQSLKNHGWASSIADGFHHDMTMWHLGTDTSKRDDNVDDNDVFTVNTQNLKILQQCYKMEVMVLNPLSIAKRVTEYLLIDWQCWACESKFKKTFRFFTSITIFFTLKCVFMAHW